jgi:hypothetical protein
MNILFLELKPGCGERPSDFDPAYYLEPRIRELRFRRSADFISI